MIELIVARASRRLKWTTDGARVWHKPAGINLAWERTFAGFILWFVSERRFTTVSNIYLKRLSESEPHPMDRRREAR